MRELNQIEKKIIRFLCENDKDYYTTTFVELLESILDANEVVYKADDSKIILYSKTPEEYINFSEKEFLSILNSHFKKMRYTLSTVVSFIDYLAKENYIYIDIPNTKRTGIFCNNLLDYRHFIENREIQKEYFSVSLNEKLAIFKKLKAYINNRNIIALQSLIDFKENNFQTSEQERFKKQYRTTWTAIIISSVFSFSILVLNLTRPKNKEFYRQVPLELKESNLYNKLQLQATDSLMSKIDSTINFFYKKIDDNK